VEGFWVFALSSYARPGVASRCLALQDAKGADVMVLLYLCWRSAAGESVREAELAETLARARLFDAHLLRPLRAARRVVRAATRALDGTGLDTAAARLAACELAIEQREAGELARGRAQDATPVPRARARAGAETSLVRYLVSIGAPPIEAREAARALAAIVFPSAPPRAYPAAATLMYDAGLPRTLRVTPEDPT